MSDDAPQWQRRGLILVAKPPTPPPMTERRRDIGDLIACPSCHARVTECCRTKSGHTTRDHSCRLVPRLCPCGTPLLPRKRYCVPCGVRIDKENRYAGVLRHRAKLKEAS